MDRDHTTFDVLHAATVMKCVYEDACPGGVASNTSVPATCASGYSGVACSGCAAGYAGLSGYCAYCHGKGPSAVAVLVLLCGVAFFITSATSLLLEDTRTASKVTTMWVLGHKDVVLLHVRSFADMLQVVALQVLIRSREKEWFVTGVLSIAGAAVGGGFSLQSWMPYLCLFPHASDIGFWSQLSVVLYIAPFALLCAVLSIPASKWLWKGVSCVHLRVFQTRCCGTIAICLLV